MRSPPSWGTIGGRKCSGKVRESTLESALCEISLLIINANKIGAGFKKK